jgi:predicted secreted protein
MADGEKGYNAELKLGGDVVGIARDVEPSLESEEQDTTTRDDGDWSDWQQGHKTLTADITALYVPTDTAYQAIKSAYMNDTDLSFEILDENGYGWSGNCGVNSMSRGEGLGDAMTVDVTITSRGTVTDVTGTS